MEKNKNRRTFEFYKKNGKRETDTGEHKETKRGKEQKGKSTKEKPCKIYIFTEGDTEEIYLQHYDNKKKGIEVIPVDPKQSTDLSHHFIRRILRLSK